MSVFTVTKLLHSGPENVRGVVYTRTMSETECDHTECDTPEGWGWMTPEMMDEMDANNV